MDFKYYCPECGYSVRTIQYGYSDEEWADMEADEAARNLENMRKYDPIMAELMDDLMYEDPCE